MIGFPIHSVKKLSHTVMLLFIRMGRRRGSKNKTEPSLGQKMLKDETRNAVFAVVFFVLFAFFALAAFGKAGFVGDKIYDAFSVLFGLGYFLVPILCLILSVSFALSIKHSINKAKFIGAAIFLISSLSLLELSFEGNGGLVGKVFEKPLLKLFDVYATFIILMALIIISVFMMFDTFINLSQIFDRMFGKKEKGEEIPQEAEEKESRIKIVGAEEQKPEPILKTISEKPGEPAIQKAKISQGKDTDDIGIKQESFLLKDWAPPPISLLERDRGKPEVGDIKANANIIKRTLQNFGIIVEMDEISIGPSITRYALKPAEGVKLSKILGLQNNLELALAAHPVRIEAPIPGKSLVGIEIPNMVKTTVGLASLLSRDEYQNSDKPLVISLGKGISGTSHFANLGKMPHLLIAGATGSGKSVSIHTIINSLLFRNSPENLKFIMIDPKRVELTLYNKIPHLLTPVITDAKKAIMSLKWAAKEMDRRYDILEKSRVRDIDSYHKNIFQPAVAKAMASKMADKSADTSKLPASMPYIVIIIDELADIMQTYPRELEAAVVRLAQMSRAVGIHLILSTQRPSVNVITGLIKANIPARIAMQVASQFDSRTIIDMAGAEKLLGAGDMLYLSGEMSKPIRLQSAYISESEVKRVAEYLAKNYEEELPGELNLEASESKNTIFESMSDGGEDEDELYEDAKETVVRAGKASTSFLQRKLRIGYARAARLMDILEEKGVIGAGEGAKPREVLIKPESGFSPQDFGNDENTENETY